MIILEKMSKNRLLSPIYWKKIVMTGLQGYEWSTERLRLGVGNGDYRAGVGTDLFQMKEVSTYNVGLFAAKNF